MYEIGIEHHEELPRITEALQHVYAAFHDVSDPLYLTSAYERYIQEELRLDERAADMIIAEQQQSGILLSTDLLLADADMAKDSYRLAVYKTIIPLKLATCDEVADLDIWLPHAYEFILPSDGQTLHAADVCLRTAGLADDACEIGVCPVKSMWQDAERASEPDFTSLEYQLSPGSACRGVYNLLSFTCRKGIISLREKHRLSAVYTRACVDAFPAAGDYC
jgi:hypothetical protein